MFERGIPITAIASYHAGRLTVYREEGSADPSLESFPRVKSGGVV